MTTLKRKRGENDDFGVFGVLDLGNNETKSDNFKTKKYVFTVNNFLELEYRTILKYLKNESVRFIMGKEVGEKCGTPHLQGYVEFSSDRWRSAVKKGFGRECYLKRAKGSLEQNFDYTTKDGQFDTKGIDIRSLTYKGPEIDLKPWQETLLEILDTEPNDRDIYWYWENKGGSGKTTFGKWIDFNREGVLCISGKSNDIKNGILTYKEKNSRFPKVIIIDVPRSNMGYVNYGAMEEVKNMFFFSGKYEGGSVNGPHPHVIIFANEEPDENMMSLDRWKIVNLREDEIDYNNYEF